MRNQGAGPPQAFIPPNSPTQGKVHRAEGEGLFPEAPPVRDYFLKSLFHLHADRQDGRDVDAGTDQLVGGEAEGAGQFGAAQVGGRKRWRR